MVGVAEVKKSLINIDLEVVGNVESSQNVDVVARSAGLLTEVAVREGDEVRKGQVLARVDDAEAKANLFKVKSDLANSKFTYYQLKSQQDLTNVQASSSVAIAQADLAAARANVDKATSVYSATQAQGETSVVQAQAQLEGAKAQLRLAELDFSQAKVEYERMLGLQRQGFASNADAQDAYAAVLSQNAAVDSQRAAVKAAEKQVLNAQQQAKKDNVSSRADILTSKSGAVSAKATVNEAQAGTSKTETFQQQLLAQQSLVEAAEAELQQAQLLLEQTVLYSPVDGFVSDRQLDPGAVASVGSVILTVQAGGEVWVVAALPQEIYRYVDKGEKCTVTIDGLRGRVFGAYVFTKDAAVDSASRQFNIRVKIDDPESLVKPGMFARLGLVLGPSDPRVAVPTSALYEKDSEARTAVAYVVDKAGKVSKKSVAYGLADQTQTMVREGLSEGDTVVVQTASPLKDGQEVKIGEVVTDPTSGSESTPSTLDASGRRTPAARVIGEPQEREMRSSPVPATPVGR